VDEYDNFFGTSTHKTQGHVAPDIMRPELIYSLDLDGVLSAMRRVRVEKLPKQSHDFYHACLDRID